MSTTSCTRRELQDIKYVGPEAENPKAKKIEARTIERVSREMQVQGNSECDNNIRRTILGSRERERLRELDSISIKRRCTTYVAS